MTAQTYDIEALALRASVESFLYREAELLDGGRLREWLTLLADEIDYRIPVRVSRVRVGGDAEFSNRAFHLVCDRGGMNTRVSRFDTGFAWAEETASRTRRIVGNVRLGDVTPDEIAARSNFHIVRSRDDFPSTVLAGERHDVLLRSGDGLRLRTRTVLLDHTYLPTENLAILF